jgi:hypothetical protein
VKTSCWRLNWILLCLVFLLPSKPEARANETCHICGSRLGLNVYLFTPRGKDQKVQACADCATLTTSCFICGLPVAKGYMRLADGRILCADDTKTAVLEQDLAEKIFDDVKREIQSMLAQLGSLPHHNIALHLEAKARLDKTGGNLISAHDDRLLMGLTRTRSDENGKLQHDVHLLYGLTRERLMVVAAHEYAHTWLHENIRRKLNDATVEGFCDWIAYRIVSGKHAEETRVLMASDYSQGQLQAFVAAEKEHGFYHVMQWVKYGIDPELDIEALDRTLVLREKRPANVAAAEPVFLSPPPPPRVAPTNLVLKGLSGSRARRFALINDCTLQVNEEAKVRLGDSNVVVRCLQIFDDAVVVKVAHENENRTLRLNSSR